MRNLELFESSSWSSASRRVIRSLSYCRIGFRIVHSSEQYTIRTPPS